MSRPSRRTSLGQTKRLAAIHRFAGVSAGVVLLYLLLTGLPLQFSPELDLGRNTVASQLILDWYGLESPDRVLMSNHVYAVGPMLFWNGAPLAEGGGFAGAVHHQDLLVVATADGLIYVSRQDPTLMNSIPLRQSPQAVGTARNQLFVRTDNAVLQLDASLVNARISTLAPANIDWAPVVEAAGSAASTHRQLYREQMLTVERLFQDLHSGRFFGPIGEWLINIASLLLLGGIISGYWIWWRTRSS